MQRQLGTALDLPRPAPSRDDPELVEDVVAYCLKGVAAGADGDDPVQGVSGLYCEWDGGVRVVTQNGQVLPYVIGPLPGRDGPVA
ncbi:hypothetical protein GT020_19335, partial [Glutamicibacter soli]